MIQGERPIVSFLYLPLESCKGFQKRLQYYINVNLPPAVFIEWKANARNK